MRRLDPGQIEVMDDRMADVLRAKTPAERLRIAADIWKSSHRFLSSVLKSEHPGWTVKQVDDEVLRRFAHGSR
jgi:hypothetical protein